MFGWTLGWSALCLLGSLAACCLAVGRLAGRLRAWRHARRHVRVAGCSVRRMPGWVRVWLPCCCAAWLDSLLVCLPACVPACLPAACCVLARLRAFRLAGPPAWPQINSDEGAHVQTLTNKTPDGPTPSARPPTRSSARPPDRAVACLLDCLLERFPGLALGWLLVSPLACLSLRLPIRPHACLHARCLLRACSTARLPACRPACLSANQRR